MNPEESMRQYFEADGSPRRLDPTERAASPQVPTPISDGACFRIHWTQQGYKVSRPAIEDASVVFYEIAAKIEEQLAESRAEVERLELKVDHLNALTDAQSKDAAENLELRAQLAAAREDVRRVDWLENEHNRSDCYPVAALTVKRNHDRNSHEWANVSGNIRAAIDSASQSQEGQP